MNRIVNTYNKAIKRMESKGWNKIYITIDVHETILEPNYGGLSDTYYPMAKECLQVMSKRDDLILIMWTCSSEEDRQAYDELFRSDDIIFNHINENPEVQGKFTWGDFETKMYTNLLLDDKAGFSYEEDWQALYKELTN